MIVRHGDIETADICYILDHPWDITESEWRLSEGNREQSLDYITKHLQLSREDGYSQSWKTPDQRPIAILGGFRAGEALFETFFVASRHMEDHALELSFEIRTILKEQAVKYLGCTCRLYSTSDHPKQLSWFRFLGFKHISANDIGNTRYFEYVAPSKQIP
jgi:hypothetical protein